LRGLVGQIVVDELKWDVLLGEKFLRLVARWTSRQRVHRDLRLSIHRVIALSPPEPPHIPTFAL
jgi:hypothetical protein